MVSLSSPAAEPGGAPNLSRTITTTLRSLSVAQHPAQDVSICRIANNKQTRFHVHWNFVVTNRGLINKKHMSPFQKSASCQAKIPTTFHSKASCIECRQQPGGGHSGKVARLYSGPTVISLKAGLDALRTSLACPPPSLPLPRSPSPLLHRRLGLRTLENA